MNSLRLSIFLFLVALLSSCGNKSDLKSPNFELQTNNSGNKFSLGDTIELQLNNKKNKTITSVDYYLDGTPIKASHPLTNLKMGVHTITAEVRSEDEVEEVSGEIILTNNEKPKVFGYEIINEYPHDITSYTQGLEFYNDTLYESTGQYGESKLRKLDYKTGEIIKNLDLADQYFGEGITILNDKIYQLTWQSKVGFIYDINTFEKLRTFEYGESKEGWGLANDGQYLYKSDGTEAIYTLNPNELNELSKIEVYTNNGKIASLNELEWISGKLYANIYQRNGVAIIDPLTGAVEGVVDFSPLKEQVTQHASLDVLNGIAYNPRTQTIFVTGKRWDKLFEVKITEK